ncbi:hypothetical protein ACUY3K_06835 [Corynebacterium uberis]|uniref:hypothetical protein n=1 Tax=Corynebacterium TaxID=1716 RepID=UPI001D0A55B5|nr:MULTISPECIES: hypothetical protein [Corynebacterium]MCZ9308834.1 hypothetical protein [Corynebacterium sp. c6VSa_13]UDL74830.1 hypothetical protein LH391_05750 [Corynebacterium uberis]UDL77047.1 hypothetical protein LH393_03655 [Corynebacterium uberis]UDL79258.1 hypothetical protein LH394_03640 [Corynebacterium uberis]UDL81463.1 hypothetical protein LH392_04065 [Corynebacterium uberis]
MGKADKQRKKMAKVRRQLASGKTKKKCCRSDPRCRTCPTVVHRLKRCGALELDDRALAKAVKKARKW